MANKSISHKKEEQKNMHKELLSWFSKHKRDLPWRRKKKRNPYHSWIAEIMLQQTRMETVLPYYASFIKKFPSIALLAKASEDELRNIWAGLGYYSRVMNIKKAAHLIMEQHQGELPSSYDLLLKLPGIGPYTAAAISSMCFQEKRPAIDGNWEKLLARLLAYPKIAKNSLTIQSFAQDLVNQGKSGEVNEAIMDLSSQICTAKNPLCHKCPLSKYCKARKLNTIYAFPVKALKKPTLELEATGLILLQKKSKNSSYKILIAKRPHKSWLQDMWDIPWWIEKNNYYSSFLKKLSLHDIYESKRTITHHKINFSIKYSFIEKSLSENAVKKHLQTVASKFAWKSIDAEEPRLPLPSQKAIIKLKEKFLNLS